MSDPTLLAIDQGTTSSRAILFSASGDILDVEQKELTLHTPQKGWVEQDANEIWRDTQHCISGVLKRADMPPVAAGITNQRETTIVWDRKTGAPVYNAIVWQDRRTADVCKRLKDEGHEETISAKTGLLLDPYFSATKISWILDNVEGARARAEAGELAFGTVETWLLWKLTHGDAHISDATNASRTMLYNIQDRHWDDELLQLFNVPRSMLPEVTDNIADFGVVDLGSADIPILGMAGDQQAALIGQGCFEPGMMKSTYGTGCFALVNMGDAFRASQNRLLTTVAYQIDGAVTYAIEGSIFIAGAAVQWLRDNLEFFEDAAQSEALARSVSDSGEVYFVPAFTGLGAPYWVPEARAMICGLGRENTKAHVTRAVLEAQAYQTCDLIGAMEEDSGFQVKVVRADGGLVNNAFVCEFLADMLGRGVEVPKVVETTAWGAAVLAGVGAGVFKDMQAASDAWAAEKTYAPKMEGAQREILYKGWKSAIGMLLR